jgi:hypothetical protein
VCFARRGIDPAAQDHSRTLAQPCGFVSAEQKVSAGGGHPFLDAVERPAVALAQEQGESEVGDRNGCGALTFALVVILQNLIRGATAPGNGASAAHVLSHYSGDRTTSFVLVATYVVSGIGLAVFLGGVTRRLLAATRPGWAVTGLVGAFGIFAVFTLVVAADQALSVAAHMDNPDLGAIQALWALHNSIFSVLDLSIALALLGLSRAAVAAGITPKAFTWLAPIGALMLVVGTIAGPAIAAGHTMALFGVAGAGFLVWLAFLIVTGVRLLRTTEPA